MRGERFILLFDISHRDCVSANNNQLRDIENLPARLCCLNTDVSSAVLCGKNRRRVIAVMSSLEDLLNKSIPELSELFVRRHRPCT